MQNMFTQKVLLAGLAVAVVIGGVVFYNLRPQVVTPPANLDTVTERAKNLAEPKQTPVTITESTTSDTAVVTSKTEPIPEPAAQAVVEPVVVTSVKDTPAPAPEPVVPAPVVVTPKPEPVPPPAPAPAPAGITKVEVATHATESSCWSIINGEVYDLTDYASRHPGGKSRILGICGKDGTRSFEGQHGGSSKVGRILAGYYIDNLAS